MVNETGAISAGGDLEYSENSVPEFRDDEQNREKQEEILRERILKEVNAVESENVDWSKMYEDAVKSHPHECLRLHIDDPKDLQEFALHDSAEKLEEREKSVINKKSNMQNEMILTHEKHSIWDDKEAQSAVLIQNEWLSNDATSMFPGLSPGQAVAQMKLIIARNLSFKGESVTQKSVIDEVKKIAENRENYKDMPLFKDRNVLMLACANYGDDKFAPQALTDSIQKQQGESMHFDRIQGENNNAEIKKAMLEKLLNTPPPLTVYFDGHGEDECLIIGGNVSVSTDSHNNDPGRSLDIHRGTENDVITKEEIIDVFKQRAEKYKQRENNDPQKQDVVVLASCYGHDFSRNVADGLGDNPKPIFLTAAEFGQRDYSNEASKFSSEFAEHVLQLKDSKTTTLGTIFENEQYMFKKEKGALIANPSIYIPENNTIMQLTENKPTDNINYV